MVGCVGNAPTLVRLDIRFTGGSRSLRGYQPEGGSLARPPTSLFPSSASAGRGMRGAERH
jgi:hypothetical protein